MRKRVILALLLVAVLAVTASCKLVAKDSAVDAATVIVQVGDTQITKAQVEAEASNVLYQQAYTYYMYGLSYDTTDADHIATARTTAITNLTQQAVIDLKIKELGLALTDEEAAAVQTQLDTDYDGYLETTRTSYFADTELTGDELESAVLEKAESTYGAKDALLAVRTATAIEKKLKDQTVADVTVTDEEIETQYNTSVSNAMASYANNLTYYANDINQGATIYYKPEGYRFVKNLLIAFTDEEKQAITDKTTALTDAQTQLESINTAIAELPEDPAADTEDQATSRASLAEQKATLEQQVTDYTAELDKLKADAVANAQPTVDAVQAALAAGDDFDAVLTQYGQDEGMKVSPAKEEGYLICAGNTTFATEFSDAALALAKVGDVSAPVQTIYGIHLIQYAGDVEPGAVPLADLRDTLQASLLTSKQNSAYTAAVESWVNEAGVKTYADRMNQ